MGKQKNTNTNELIIESIKISYPDNESRSSANSMHNELYKQLHLKTEPPKKISAAIARLGVSEILITIILTSIAKDLWIRVLDLLKKTSESQIVKGGGIHIKFDDNDPGKRFPFHKDTNWEKFLRVIEKYINQRYEKKNETLMDLIEGRVELDEKILKLFETEATFLDIDVVSSTILRQTEPDLIISAYSFEQCFKYVKEKAEENRGKILNAVGDEVMAWFGVASNAINCALAIFRDRDEFNRTKNKLQKPFQFRIGINSGKALLDEPTGKAFGRGVLDFAGHLQKEASPGTFLISENTYNLLEDKSRFQQSKFIEKDKKWSYILVDK